MKSVTLINDRIVAVASLLSVMLLLRQICPRLPNLFAINDSMCENFATIMLMHVVFYQRVYILNNFSHAMRTEFNNIVLLFIRLGP
jgi:hypothetical protein